MTGILRTLTQVTDESISAIAIAMTITSLLGTFIIGFSMLPQTIATFKTRQTANISLGLYLIMGIATLLITFYGIGLCCVPLNLKEFIYLNQSNFPNVTQQYYANLPSYWNVVTGYTIPGAAIIFGELFCAVTSFIIAIIKIINQQQAKKLNMTEAEYIEYINGLKNGENVKVIASQEPSKQEEIIQPIIINNNDSNTVYYASNEDVNDYYDNNDKYYVNDNHINNNEANENLNNTKAYYNDDQNNQVAANSNNFNNDATNNDATNNDATNNDDAPSIIELLKNDEVDSVEFVTTKEDFKDGLVFDDNNSSKVNNKVNNTNKPTKSSTPAKTEPVEAKKEKTKEETTPSDQHSANNLFKMNENWGKKSAEEIAKRENQVITATKQNDIDEDNDELTIMISLTHGEAAKILEEGKTTVFFKRLPAKPVQRVIVYLVKTDKIPGMVIGEFDIAKTTSCPKTTAWNQYGTTSTLKRSEFNEYYEGAKKVYAMVIDDFISYSVPKTLKDYGMNKGPAGFTYLK